MLYAENKEKTTDENETTMFVTGVNCNRDIALVEMIKTQIKFDKTTGNVAYHAYQSFKRGEITPKLAHKIGVELAEKMFPEHQVLVATHLNTGTYHNHFVINSVNMFTGKKFDCNKGAYFRFRGLSDELCEKYNLTVIKNPKGRTARNIYFAEKRGEPTKYNLMRQAIDEAMEMCINYGQFKKIMYKKGYIINDDYNRKYPTIRSINDTKAVRMYRLGEKYNHLDKLYKIYENEKLNILGTFSHLCVADSNTKEDIDFTNRQIELFNETIKRIKTKGYDTGKVHLQSSYGVINYTGLDYDYVRVGILMYGINSSYESYQLIHLNLKPVLSLKARITSVKEINKNDSVSYGRTYIATENRKIASVSIGYADGIPRNLSNKNMQVKINESYGTVIGRICMDQLLIDISDISNVKVGDIITIIGEDNNITAEQVADKADTITNELLCRLGDRLARIIV